MTSHPMRAWRNWSGRAAALLLLAGFGLTACNTVEGAGEDIQAGGKAIERTSKDART